MVSTMNEEDYNKLINSGYKDYYKGRWKYYKEVIKIVKEVDPKNVLELGPGKRTIVNNCDIMINPIQDKYGKPDNEYNKSIIFNATEKSWPIENKKYDLFIALQVWEHLTNKQTRAFREVKRISNMAILSFPYLWECPFEESYKSDHHMIDEELIGDWTLNIKPSKIFKVPKTGEKLNEWSRIIYFWDFKND